MRLQTLFSIALVLCLFELNSGNAQTTYLSETFQGTGIPSGWTQTTLATDGGWKFGVNTLLQSGNFPIPLHTKFACTNDDACNCDKSADRLVVAPLNLTSATAVVLQFDYYYLAIQELATIEVSVDSGATWDVVEILPASGGDWVNHFTNITAFAAGHAHVLISFLYNDTGTFGYGLCVDNLVVYEPVAADAFLSAITPVAYTGSSYEAVNGSVTLGGTITNLGASDISNFIIKWTDGTNTYPYTITDVVPVVGSVDFVHSQPYTIPATGAHTITMWVELANDNIPANDTLTTVITGAAFMPAHKVTIEDQTICSTGNAYWSVRGIVYMDSFSRDSRSSMAELISVHSSVTGFEPMANDIYWNGSFYGNNVVANAWPQIVVDRKSVDNPTYIFNQFNSHADDFGVADVSVSLTYDTATRALDVTADAHFAIAVSPLIGHYNLALVLTEDSVHGTDSTYAQRNAYAGGANGPMASHDIDFTQQPDPVPASVMYYMNVAREILGTFKGTDGSLPDTIAENSTHSYTFPTYTVPAEYHAENMRAIVLLIDTLTGEIRNANGAPVLIDSSTTGVNNHPVKSTRLNIFPNPFTYEAAIVFALDKTEAVSIRVSNLLGETVFLSAETAMAAGEHSFILNGKNISPGMYVVTLFTGENSISRKVLLN